MAMKKHGTQTNILKNPPSIVAVSSVVGPREGKGPLGKFFDTVMDDEIFSEETWEKSESKLMKDAINLVLEKSKLANSEIDFILGGDLLDQCISSNFAIRDSNIPFLGLYGACSTYVEALLLSSMMIDGGFANNVLGVTSSHFCSAEKQFRFPLELGLQRPQSSQWTVTGSGAFILSNTQNVNIPIVESITAGKIIDMGIKDSNNMGAAMAPAAAETLLAHFNDTGKIPNDYDMIITGDLGYVGMEILNDILKKEGCKIQANYNDCGVMIFDREKQETHSGGSGCGCCATVFSGYIYSQMLKGNLNNVLLIGTGALMSPTSIQQGESIPSIAHAVSISMRRG